MSHLPATAGYCDLHRLHRLPCSFCILTGDLWISPEAMEDIRSWDVEPTDEVKALVFGVSVEAVRDGSFGPCAGLGEWAAGGNGPVHQDVDSPDVDVDASPRQG